jgi:hypothetical protein
MEKQAAGIYCPGALPNWTFGAERKFRIWLLVNSAFYLYRRLMLKLRTMRDMTGMLIRHTVVHTNWFRYFAQPTK